MLDTYKLFSIINNSVVLRSWLDLKAAISPISEQEGKIQNVNIENTVWYQLSNVLQKVISWSKDWLGL